MYLVLILMRYFGKSRKVGNNDQLKDLCIDMTKLFASGDLEGKTIAGWVIVKKLVVPID